MSATSTTTENELASNNVAGTVGSPRSAAITITEKAVAEMNRVLTEKKLPAATVLRVGVAGGGCSGFSYSLGFDDKCDEMNDTS